MRVDSSPGKGTSGMDKLGSEGLCAVPLRRSAGSEVCVLTVLDLDEVNVTPRFAEDFGSVLSGVGGSAGGWRCCWGAPSLHQLPPATPKNPPPCSSLLFS